MLSSLTRSMLSLLLDPNGNEASGVSQEVGDAIDTSTSGIASHTSGATPILRVLHTVSVSGAAQLGATNLVNTGTAIALSLPAATAGQWVVVKDATGAGAGTNNITITPASGTIDGAGTLVLSTNRAKTTLVNDGTNWFVVG